MDIVKMLNLAVAFVLELGMFASFGIWASSLHKSTSLKVSAGIVATALAIILWAVLAAPNATTRLPQPWLFVFQFIIFAVASLLLYKSGHMTIAPILFGVWIISTVLSLIWKQ